MEKSKGTKEVGSIVCQLITRARLMNSVSSKQQMGIFAFVLHWFVICGSEKRTSPAKTTLATVNRVYKQKSNQSNFKTTMALPLMYKLIRK